MSNDSNSMSNDRTLGIYHYFERVPFSKPCLCCAAAYSEHQYLFEIPNAVSFRSWILEQGFREDFVTIVPAGVSLYICAACIETDGAKILAQARGILKALKMQSVLENS